MRSHAIGATVEARGEDVLVPRTRGGREPKHLRRRTLHNAPPDQSPKLIATHVSVPCVVAREQAELLRGDARQFLECHDIPPRRRLHGGSSSGLTLTTSSHELNRTLMAEPSARPHFCDFDDS